MGFALLIATALAYTGILGLYVLLHFGDQATGGWLGRWKAWLLAIVLPAGKGIALAAFIWAMLPLVSGEGAAVWMAVWQRPVFWAVLALVCVGVILVEALPGSVALRPLTNLLLGALALSYLFGEVAMLSQFSFARFLPAGGELALFAALGVSAAATSVVTLELALEHWPAAGHLLGGLILGVLSLVPLLTYGLWLAGQQMA